MNICQGICEELQISRHCDVAMNCDGDIIDFDGGAMRFYEKHHVAITLTLRLYTSSPHVFEYYTYTGVTKRGPYHIGITLYKNDWVGHFTILSM